MTADLTHHHCHDSLIPAQKSSSGQISGNQPMKTQHSDNTWKDPEEVIRHWILEVIVIVDHWMEWKSIRVPSQSSKCQQYWRQIKSRSQWSTASLPRTIPGLPIQIMKLLLLSPWVLLILFSKTTDADVKGKWSQRSILSNHSPSQTAPPGEAARVKSRMFTKVGHTLSAQQRLLGVRTCSEGE